MHPRLCRRRCSAWMGLSPSTSGPCNLSPRDTSLDAHARKRWREKLLRGLTVGLLLQPTPPCLRSWAPPLSHLTGHSAQTGLCFLLTHPYFACRQLQLPCCCPQPAALSPSHPHRHRWPCSNAVFEGLPLWPPPHCSPRPSSCYLAGALFRGSRWRAALFSIAGRGGCWRWHPLGPLQEASTYCH